MKKTLSTVMKYIKKKAGFVILSIVFALVSSLLALLVPIFFGEAIDLVIAEGTDIGAVAIKLLQAALIALVTALMQWFMALINNKVTYEIVEEIRNEAFEKIQRLPLKYLDAHPVGEIVSRMVSDVDTFADGLLMGFTQAFTGVVTIIGTLLCMWNLSHITTLVVVLVTPMSLFVANFIAKNTHDLFIKQSESKATQTSLIDEMIGEERTVKSLGYEEEAMKRFDEANKGLAGISLKALFYSSLVNPSTRFVNAIVYALVALVGGSRVLMGLRTVGELTAMLAYANQYTKPFNEISGVVTELQNAFACAGRVFALLEEEEEEARDETFGEGYRADGEVLLNEIDFSYSDDKPLIEDFSIDVKKGQTIAIVGPTGCGKTTLINLLMRFYDIKGGSISIDGKDTAHMNRHALRSQFGMVLQDTWIKEDTVLENIRLGRKDASREEVIAAAKESYAHSFIKRLPKGYDTVLTGGGEDLSQGQKQLLCIARVMLAMPPMLILDEATSSIDTRTEMKIQNAFHKLMEGRTSFIVAHRLSTIMDADVIIVMKDGHIVEQGSHKELLAQNGFYATLFNAQFAGSD